MAGALARLLGLLARAALLAALVLLGAPALLSLGAGAALLEAAARPLLGDTFSVERVWMDASGGLHAEGLRVDRPGGRGPVLEAARLDLRLRPASLLAGRLDAEAALRGLRITLARREAPRLERLVLRAARAVLAEAAANPGGHPRLGRLALRLEPAELRLLDSAGALETRLELEASLAVEQPDAPAGFEASCRAFAPSGRAAGALDCRGRFDPARRILDLALRGQRLDLAAWRALAGWPEGPPRLSGLARLELRCQAGPARIALQGELEALDLALRHPALGPIPLRQELGRLEGEAFLDPSTGAADLSALRGRCGPLKLQGLDPGRAAELLGGEAGAGLAASLELSELPRHPALPHDGALLAGRLALEGAVPAGRSGRSVLRLAGEGVRWRDDRVDSGPVVLRGEASWSGALDSLRGALSVQTDALSAAGGEPLALTAGASAEQGKARLEFTLAGGAEASGELALDLLGAGLPASAALRLAGFPVHPSMAPVLALLAPYAVAPGARELQGRLSLRASGEGSLEGALAAPWRETLARWKGRLDYEFSNLISPASPALAPLLGAFGNGSSFTFPKISGGAALASGTLSQAELRLEAAGAWIRAKGTTALDGALEYSFDCGPILERLAGRRLLAALGSLDRPVALRGTLDAPEAIVEPLDLGQTLREPR